MVEFLLDFSQKKMEKTKIYTRIYNLLAIGQKALGQCLFQGCSSPKPLVSELVSSVATVFCPQRYSKSEERGGGWGGELGDGDRPRHCPAQHRTLSQ